MKVAVEDGGVTVAIHVPMTFRRRSGRKEIVLPDGAEPVAETQDRPPDPVVVAIARAFTWQEALDTGDVASVEALAERLGVDGSYVRRILQLASLIPAAVEAALERGELDGISLTALSKDLPFDWQRQADRLGLGPRRCGRHPRGRAFAARKRSPIVTLEHWPKTARSGCGHVRAGKGERVSSAGKWWSKRYGRRNRLCLCERPTGIIPSESDTRFPCGVADGWHAH
jgi:hypothetical protein